MPRITLYVALVSIAISMLSIIIAMRTQSNVYNRILYEFRQELEPVYKEFDIRLEDAKSFRELLRPLVSVSQNASKEDTSSTRPTE